MPNRKLKEFEELTIKSFEISNELDFELIFGNKNPVQIEIGSGKGTFLVNQAKIYPEVNYIGIEWANKYYKYAVDRIGRWGLENVRMLRTDGAVFIKEHIKHSTVSGYHIYFPDPWPKKRHHKRRFICKENLMMLRNTLKEGGWINIATDHKEYFEWMCEHIDMCGQTFSKVDYKYPAGAEKGEMAGTNFERKYIKEGRKIYTTAIAKKSDYSSPGQLVI